MSKLTFAKANREAEMLAPGMGKIRSGQDIERFNKIRNCEFAIDLYDSLCPTCEHREDCYFCVTDQPYIVGGCNYYLEVEDGED